MTAPGWFQAALASLMLAVAAGFAVRFAIVRRGVDALPAAMGVAMSGMLLPRLSVLPPVIWEIGFGAAAAWLAGLLITGRRLSVTRAPAAHLIECVAMVFMLLPVASSAAGPPAVLALLLVLALVGCVIARADSLINGSGAATRGVRFAASGHIAMSVAMSYMLIQMV